MSDSYKSMTRLLGEQLEHVIPVTKGDETKLVTKAEVIAAQAINRAMEGDMTMLQSILKIIPPPPETERFTPEDQANADAIIKS